MVAQSLLRLRLFESQLLPHGIPPIFQGIDDELPPHGIPPIFQGDDELPPHGIPPILQGDDELPPHGIPPIFQGIDDELPPHGMEPIPPQGDIPAPVNGLKPAGPVKGTEFQNACTGKDKTTQLATKPSVKYIGCFMSLKFLLFRSIIHDNGDLIRVCAICLIAPISALPITIFVYKHLADRRTLGRSYPARQFYPYT